MYTIISDIAEIKSELKRRDQSKANAIRLFKGKTGVELLQNCYLWNSGEMKRESKTKKENGNSYNLLLNNLPSWSDFPKRENSIILTTNLQTAKAFSNPRNSLGETNGKVYRVFTDPSAEIAIAPASDIWYSFTNALNLLGLRGKKNELIFFNDLLRDIFKQFGIENFDEDWITFQKAINVICDKADEHCMVEDASILYKELNKDNGGIEFFDKLFSPETNGFLKMKLGECDIEKYTNNEVWTSGQCLLIDEVFLSGL